MNLTLGSKKWAIALSLSAIFAVTATQAYADNVTCSDLFLTAPLERVLAPLADRDAFLEIARSLRPEDPYTLSSDLPPGDLEKLYRLFGAGLNFKSLESWLKSEAHARVFYEVLSRRGLAPYQALLKRLRASNRFFKDTRLSGGALITYSFEKEGRAPEIALMYRPADVDEQKWFSLPDAKRFDILSGLKLPYKTFLPTTVVAPTSLKPSYLGGYSVDPGNLLAKSISWEVAHKAFELTDKAVMSDIREVAAAFNETHSIHAHVVFEMPVRYAHVAEFKLWFKTLNDALYLSGMEEGLHGSEMTGVLNLAEDGGRGSWLFGRHFRLKNLESINRRGSKFFSVGLRGRMYGDPSSTAFLKLGLEYRDTTRNLDRLETSLESVSDEIAERRWERVPVSSLPPDLFRLKTASRETEALLLEAGLRPEIARRMTQAEATCAFPLMALERGAVINYREGRVEYASADFAARVKRARKTYIKKLFDLQTELDEFAQKKVVVEKAELELALRQTLTEWAREARPSERFGLRK